MKEKRITERKKKKGTGGIKDSQKGSRGREKEDKKGKQEIEERKRGSTE